MPAEPASVIRPAATATPWADDLLRACRFVPPGRVNIVALDGLRERLGRRWPELEGTVHAVLERLLRAQLGERDVFARLAPTEYLVVSTALPAEAAQLRCLKIVEALHRHFLGESDIGRIAIRTRLRETADGPEFEEVTAVAVLARHRAAARRRPAATGLRAGTHGAGGTISQPAAAPEPAPAFVPGGPAEGPAPAETVAPPATAPEAEPEEDAFSDPGGPIPHFDEEVPPRTRLSEVLYAPMWDLRAQVVSTYYCVTRRQSTRRRADGLAPAAEDWLERARLDFETLRHALFVLGNLPAGEGRPMLALPIHYETVATTRWRRVYVGFARTAPRRIRQNLLIELCGVPAGITPGRMLEMVGILRPFCRALLVRLSGDERDLMPYALRGVHAVGLDLDETGGSDTEIAALLDRLARAAERRSLWTYIHNARRSTIVLAAAAAGVRHVGGAAVADLDSAPRPIRRYGWDHFIGRLAQAA
ncbi:MAG: hypothetical protein IRY94_12040 [Rhodospirillaceae bacterium]|nr:hypothetical protein [Rhodospirillaceae bacterium]